MNAFLTQPGRTWDASTSDPEPEQELLPNRGRQATPPSLACSDRLLMALFQQYWTETQGIAPEIA